MIEFTNEIALDLNRQAQFLKDKILSSPDTIKISGMSYYVSADGDDANDGRTPNHAWKTVERVSQASELRAGDGVFFRRGDVFRGTVDATPYVTYGAYGEGEKPKIYSWDEDIADPSLWELYDSKNNIWKYKKKILDVGNIVFNDGEYHTYKHMPSYIDGRFVCRDDEDTPFVISNELKNNLDIYWHFEDKLVKKMRKGESVNVPDVEDAYGDLYLRCNDGNPGKVFNTAEACVRRLGFRIYQKDGVKIDNLCIKYIGWHALGGYAHCLSGLHVTNCEIGWIGGVLHNYFGEDPNYPQGQAGVGARLGNAVEIYGGCDDYRVENCYIYQVYDAGVTHQVNTFGRRFEMKNVRYLSNLIEKCVYSIEYFLNVNDDKNGQSSIMQNVEIAKNILRQSGEGWGQQRHNKHTPAHIKGWSFTNTARIFSIHDNIFDRAAYRMLHIVAEKPESIPTMYNNTYIQYEGNMIGKIGANEVSEPADLYFDENADASIAEVFGDKNAEIYVIK